VHEKSQQLSVCRNVWFGKSKIEVNWFSDTRQIIFCTNLRAVAASGAVHDDSLAHVPILVLSIWKAQ